MEIRIKAYDEATNALTPCKVVIHGADRTVPGSDPAKPGDIFYCRGEFSCEAASGEYRVEIFKGKLYEPFRETVNVHEADVEMTVRLRPLTDAAKLGLYAFDAHSHVSRNEHLGTGNLDWASTVMMAEGFHLFYAGSPYDHDTHLEYLNNDYKSDAPYRDRFAAKLQELNRDDFIVDIGNELIKVRYGHIVMLNFVQKPPFSRYYDEVWDPWNGSNRAGNEPAYEIAYPYEAVLAERGEYSYAFAAHPTSWWWGPDGILITNIASTLAFDSLAGAIDGMVVMGYGSDKLQYQEVWFEALRNGHFLPATAETDVSFDGVPKQKFLQYKTYAFLDSFSKEALGIAMKQGRNIVSSGPLLVMTVGGELPGAVLTYRSGETFKVVMEAYRCHEAAISQIQLLVNGRVAAEYEANDPQVRRELEIQVEADSFVVAKCYDFAGNVAMTSPVYIRNSPFVNRNYLSDVRIAVTKGGKSAQGLYWLDDAPGRYPFLGELRVRMNPSSSLHLSVEDEMRTVKLFELAELQAIFKHLYLGDFNRDKRYEPGEVPPEAFRIKQVKDILDRVEINVEF